MEIDLEFDEDVFIPSYRHLLPKYHEDKGTPIADGAADINLLWGGRDSGKSHFIAQRLVMDCLTSSYFRCLLNKKTGNSIKESQWQTIKDVVEEWELDELFEFKSAPLEIICCNGNRFIARGADEPKKLKSLRNINRAWLEESNQLNEADFITILTTLRSNDGGVQIWMSFNPETEEDYEEFYLYKLFFKKQKRSYYNTHFTDKITIDAGKETVSFKFTSTHTTYHDNPEYVTPLRRAFHEALQEMNPHYYNMFTKGLWSTMRPGQPWAFAYVKEKHTGMPVLNRAQNVYLSFDFNRNPICCSVIQWYDNKIRVLETIKLTDSDIYKLCAYIKQHYPRCLFIVTGDASGKNSSAMVKDNLNYYKIIRKELALTDGQLRVPTVNPSLDENQVLTNAVLLMYNVEIHATKADGLHYDMLHVRSLPNGEIDKGDRNDPKKQADAIDTFRYWCNVFMADLLKAVQG